LTERLFGYTGDVAQWQGSLFQLGDPRVAGWHGVERFQLDATSWIDVVRGFVEGADEVAAELIEGTSWRQGRRQMYDREVDDPRLSRWFTDGTDPPHPLLGEAVRSLAEHYGRPFRGPGLNFYRDGRDSVAFHRDRELRDTTEAMVAVLTLGAPRPFLVRPRSGGRSRDLRPASGDLLVMGGRCQLDWEHGVPKVARAGARVSASWRWCRRPGPGAYGAGTSSARRT
jgi:alkylated DNA repair dioxygenase AlkB